MSLWNQMNTSALTYSMRLGMASLMKPRNSCHWRKQVVWSTRYANMEVNTEKMGEVT